MSPYEAWQRELASEGAVYPPAAAERCGPVHFGRPDDEYAAITGGAALVDLGSRTRIELIGADRGTFLHNLCTNEVRKLEPCSGCEAFFLNAKGHIIGHGFVFADADRHLLESAAGQADLLLAHLDRYLIREDVQVRDRSDDWAEFLLAGPQAAALLECATGQTPPEQLLQGAEVNIAGVPAHVRRVDFTGTENFLLFFAVEQCLDVWRKLTGCGAHPCGEGAFDTVRAEAGFPIFGRDISDRNLPQELARDARAISFVKGCYIGQETVARIDALGHVNRVLVGLKLAAPKLPPAGSDIAAAGQPVGNVTSAVLSPKLAAPLVLGYVRRGYEQPGTMLEVDHAPAEVVALPL